jgi:hypothetical protein
MIISGTLPNNTVWWISRDGKKVWIESKELENQKLVDKGYDIEKDRIFASKPRRQIGELTGSKLERRLYKDSWRVTLDAFLDIYPDLVSEIENKSIEEKKKRRQTKSKAELKVPKTLPQKEIEKKKIDKEEINKESVQEVVQEKKEKIIEKSYFDITRPYVEWIKGEIDKSPNGELTILSDDMKEKMGEGYQNMHVMRIYFGLKKVLSEIGIGVELGGLKGKSALIMKREGR